MVHKALQLKQLKPAGGFHFSLQQQGMRSIYVWVWVSELLLPGHSMYEPKRYTKLRKVYKVTFIFFYTVQENKIQNQTANYLH